MWLSRCQSGHPTVNAEACQVLFEELSEKECKSCETCLVTTCDVVPVFTAQNVAMMQSFWGRKFNKKGDNGVNNGDKVDKTGHATSQFPCIRCAQPNEQSNIRQCRQEDGPVDAATG